MKPNRRFFMISLGVLAFILLAYGLLRMKFGPFLPPDIDKNLPNAVIIGTLGILMWNRKIRADELRAETERKRIEAEAASARLVGGENAESDEGLGGDERAEHSEAFDVAEPRGKADDSGGL